MPFMPPPLHPILVNFTAALLPVSVLSDVLGVVLRKESLKSAGWWMLLYAAAVTPLTAIAGWLWMRSMGDMDHPEMTAHKWLGTALAVAFVAVALWRWRIYRNGNKPNALYLVAVGVVALALVVQGHLGGTMSFGGGSGSSPPAGEQPQNEHHEHHADMRYQWRDHIDLKD